MNDLFEGMLTDDDQLAWVNTVKGKLMESDILATQAANSTKAQFSDSPTLKDDLMGAIIDVWRPTRP